MKKRMIAIAMAWVLLLQTVFGAGMPTASADSDVLPPGDAATVTDAAYGPVSLMAASKESILTKVKLLDQNGTVIDAVYNPSREGVSKPGDPVRIEYEWSLKNGHGYKAGDKFEFDIPKEFTVYSKFTEQLNTDNGSIGEFTVEPNGHVTVVFNELVDNSEVRGTMEVHTEFSKTEIKGSVEVPITFPIRGGDQVAKVNFAPFGGKPLTKQGTAYKDQKIDWTLDVNTKLDKLNAPVVSDIIPDELKLDDTSIKVYKLNVNVDREPDEGSEVSPAEGNYTVSAEPDGSAFQIQFNDPEFKSAYRIRYTTNVTGEEKTEFTNQAELKVGTDVKATANKTVPVHREELITKEKGMYDKVNQTVAWKLKYNYGEKTFEAGEAKIEDRFSNTMVLDGGIVVKEVGGAILDPSAYSFVKVTNEDGKNGFTLTFNSKITAAYDIEYKTKVTKRVYENVPVDNVAYSTYNGKETRKTATHTFTSGIGVKTRQSTDYSTKEVTWKIVVNNDRQPMTNLVIEDTFSGGGLEFIPGTVTVTAASGGAVITPAVDASTPTQGFKLTFNGTFTDEYTITYKTKFTPGKSLYRNVAVLDWTEKTGDYTDPIQVAANFDPNAYTKNNGAKDGKYDASGKTLTWTVYANYNGFDVKNAVFTDPLLQNQTLVDGTLKVYQMSVKADGTPEQGAEVNLDPGKIDTSNGRIQIDFGNIHEPYWITFDTKLDRTLVDEQIANKATLSGDNSAEWNWDKNVDIPHGEVYVSKTGVRGVDKDADKINWQIKINEGQSYVENAKIVDTPSANQIVKPETFELYEGIVGSNGDVSTGKLLEKNKDYEVVLHTDDSGELKSFELILPKTIETAYILKYQSEIAVSVDKEKITNQVSFIGDHVSVGTRETEQAIEIRLSSGSGTGSGVRGGLEVTKVDKDSPGTVLPGAKFELKNSKGESIGVKETGADGKITFTKLLYDTYTLTEFQAPAGYKPLTLPLTVKIDKEVQSTGGVKALPVPNEKIPYIPLGGLEILKVAKEDNSKVLPGAKFQLQDAGLQKDPVVLTTDEAGIARINGLIFGDYILKEIEAPAGYILDSTEHKVTIDKESVVKMTLMNEKQPDPVVQLEVVKVDKDDTSKKLAGATFVLQDVEKRREPVTVTTDTYGVALFPNLLYGEYILKETAAPAGYVLDATERPVTIGATTELVEGKIILPISNAKKPQVPGNPGNSGGGNSGNTGGSSHPQNPTQPNKPNDPSTPPAKDGDGGNNNDQGDTVVPGTGNGSAGDTTGPVQTPGQDTEQDGKNNSLRDSGDETGDGAGKKGRGVKVLPKTGEESALPVQLAGVSLIALGLLLKRRMILKK